MQAFPRFRWGVVLVTVLALGWSSSAMGAAGPRHTGLVTGVDEQSRILTVEELGPGGVRRTLRVHVAPDARVVLSQRNPDAAGVDDAFRDTGVALGDVRRGDFVVVELVGSGRPPTASMVMVTFRGSGTARQRRRPARLP